MIGCSRPMVSRLIAIMIESRLLARRGNQYVLLKKWDLDNGRNVQRSARRDAKSAGRPAPFGLPTGLRKWLGESRSHRLRSTRIELSNNGQGRSRKRICRLACARPRTSCSIPRS